MTPSRTVLKRALLENANFAVKVIEVDPVKGFMALNKCTSIIMQIYDSFEEEATP